MKPKHILFYVLFAMFANTSTIANAQAINVQDSLALVDLYKSTNGPNWIKNKFWLKGPVSKWYGITVRDTSVTDIFLGSNNLVGTLPSSLGNMPRLVNMVMPYNQLSGSIPSSFKNLSSLSQLNLEGNQLNGSIPKNLGNLINLNYLLLSANQLTGTIPGSLGKLVNVYQLDLDHNLLSGSIPSSFGNFTLLNYLYLNNNQLSGSIPSSIGNMVNLYHLVLNNNQLTGNIPSSFGNMISLTKISIDHNELSGKIPETIGNITNLAYLFAGNNQLSGSIPANIINLTNLYTLDLSYNQLRGSIPININDMSLLHWMYLNNNKLSGSIPLGLKDLEFFELNLSYNRFTFDGMELAAQSIGNYFMYSNQSAIPVLQNGKTLSVSAGGTLSNNTYKWFKLGHDGYVANTGDSVFHPSSNGKYFVQVTNSIATALTLESDTIKYSSNVLNNTSKMLSSADQLGFTSKENRFIIYPNPAKDILHIQNTGKTTFTLTNQSGKILITKTINGSGEINVSHLSAGLYYLKNNETGAMQKVMITK